MSRSARIHRHLQSNVVGYVALFVALSGTAIALPGKNKVDSNDLKRGAVKARALAKNAVKARAIRTGAVTTPKLRSGAVDADKLAPGSVGTGSLADSAITSPKLANDSVVRRTILQGTVNGVKIANGAITPRTIRDGSLLAEEFAPGQLSDGFVLTGVGPGPYPLPPLQRPGRLLVIVAVRGTECGAPPGESCSISAELNGVPIEHASVAVTPEELPGDKILFGIAPVEPGQNAITLQWGHVFTFREIRIAGVLLQ